jgi:SulP family sulfate permease
MPDGTATTNLYQPKLVTIVREGYTPALLRKDLLAGLTVAIVALPLSMAIAVASGVSPERGLYTAIVGGFVVSALGGSRFQIGGPAGAFIVLVAATGARLGLAARGPVVGPDADLGRRAPSGIADPPYPACGDGGFYFRHCRHHPGQPAEGFRRPQPSRRRARPADSQTRRFVSRLAHTQRRRFRHRPRFGRADIRIALAAARLVVAASCAVALLHLPAQTIGSRFGGLPHGLPLPHLPHIDMTLLWKVLPAALSFTLLGGVESLLSAKVADSMTGRKHRSNMELVAQGIANMASALFGGICVTGTIARTATNIRAGAASGT